jgi:hypothetical protein
MHNNTNTLTEQSARGRSLRSTAISPLQISSNTNIYCPAKRVPRGDNLNQAESQIERQTNNQIQLYGVR